MRMDYGFKLEMNQKLLMTPQLRQAIAILQLSSMELSTMIEEAIMENPVLEADYNTDTDEPVAETSSEETAEYLDWADYINDGAAAEHHERQVKEKLSLELFTKAVTSLHEHLEMQLQFAVIDDAAVKIGKYLIGCIDDNGYLSGTTEEAANVLSIPEAKVIEVLELIHTFDPAGVGARSLSECLKLQLEERDIQDDLTQTIIEKYLDEVAQGKIKHIAETLGSTLSEVQQALDIIRGLDPKPGLVFSPNQATYIIPDITIERVNGQYVIIINDNNVPRLSVSPYYHKVAKEGENNEARKFVEGRLSAAVWLIRSIEQRRRTLYNVTEAIIDLQRDFFDIGPKELRPLTMKKVADRLGIHESTVSRAIANKYAATPHGLVALRTFFSSSVQNAAGEDIAATTIKREIKELVAGENTLKPYSDQAISDILAKKGTTISRRTVTKYREELGIASSAKRKRY
jgi:RNA polymerase sigma-54 factor